MVDYIAAIKRPFSDAKLFLTGCLIVLIFGLASFIVILPVALFTSFFNDPIIGRIPSSIAAIIFAIPVAYFAKCGITAARKENKLPEWNISGLLSDGIMIAVITFIYSIPLMLVTPFVFGSVLGPNLYGDYISLASATGAEQSTYEYQAHYKETWDQILPRLPLLVFLLGLAALISWMILSAATFRFMEHESFKEAFNIPLVFRHAFSSSYILSSLITFLILFVTVIVFGLLCLLLLISVIGIVLIPIIFLIYYFWFAVMAYTIMGQAYGELNL